MGLGATLFVKNSLEAVEFYKEAFGVTLGSENMTPVYYPDGTYLHAPLFIDGQEIFDVSEESRNGKLLELMLASDQRPITSIGINLHSEDKVRKAFNLLAEGGRVLNLLWTEPWCALGGDVVDKYGVNWFVCCMDDPK
ncbi:MAG: VOC family protein [Defluviitaleaceae bacterium]|nr:VOC family protein [Defluviitaleaceae bacterium]